MPRTNITVKKQPSVNGVIAADAFKLTGTAADAVNGNQCDCTGQIMLHVRNTSLSTPYDLTINSAPDALLRKGDISTYEIDADSCQLIGPFPVSGWAVDGKLQFNAENTALVITPISIPGL